MTSAPQLPPWLAREYPFTPRSFTTPRGARMSYVDEGPRGNEAVVMVHGNPTWSFYYRRLIQALSPTMRCIAPDHIGMGLSEKPENYDYTLATRISDLEALIASLGLKRVHLVVHDWGGAIGFGFAARFLRARGACPEPVERAGPQSTEAIGKLVILNTAAFAADRIPARIALCKLPLIGPLLVRGGNGFAWPATWMAMHRRALTSAEKRGYLLPYDSWAHRVAVSAFVRDIPLRASHPTWATLAAVESALDQFRNRPTYIVWGGRDFCFNDYFLGRWREIFPQASVDRLADAGHYVLEDASAEVIPQIAAFLK